MTKSICRSAAVLFACVVLLEGSECRGDGNAIDTSQDRIPIETILKKVGSVPRPEHPRPDRFRPDWCNLNGVWEFAFDPHDVGRKEGWSDGRPLPGRIVVPFCPESELSGLGDTSFHPLCWYARTFDVPEQVRSGRVLLHLGAVDYRSKIWLNGQLLGEHEGGYDPLEFEVTKILRPVGNRIVIRVDDDPHEGKPLGKQDSRLLPSGCRYMRITGIWQTVWLERVGKAFARDWTLHADLATGELSLDIRLDGADDGIRVLASVRRDGKEVAGGATVAHDSRAQLAIRVPQAASWSPEHPVLYDLDLALQTADGNVVDRVHTYAGFRAIDIRNGRYYLNGKPFFLISALDQGYYPDGLYTAPTDEALRADVQWAKRFGLNSVRKHQIVADPRYYYWCDRLGLTVWGEMASWSTKVNNSSDHYVIVDTDRFLTQWTRCVRGNINHPCIITWVPTNEFKSHNDERLNQIKARIYDATKQLDSTRPVIDVSGYCHVKTDIVDLHVNPDDWQQWWSKWRQTIDRGDNLQLYGDNRCVFAGKSRYAGQPIIISEMGLWQIKQYPPLKAIWGSSGGFPTPKQYVDHYRDNLLAMTADPAAGFSYVQLYDVEGEVNGYPSVRFSNSVGP